MFAKFKLTEQGITLIELLTVVGLLAILSSGLIILVNPFQKIGQANDAKRKSDLAQLTRALEIYYQDFGSYPQSSGAFTITGVNWGDSWPQYMSRLPNDPSGGKTYVYYTPNSGACSNYQCYYLYASLQSPKDPQLCFPGTGAACPNAVTNSLDTSCGGVCNYGVSSQNTSP